MSSSRTILIESIMADFTSRHVRSPRVFLPHDEADREKLLEWDVFPGDAAEAPDVVIHDRERDWLFLFDAVDSHRHMDEARRENLAARFAPSDKGLIFFSAFTDRDTFARFAETIAWETEVWIAAEPGHMIHYNGRRFLGPYPKMSATQGGF